MLMPASCGDDDVGPRAGRWPTALGRAKAGRGPAALALQAGNPRRRGTCPGRWPGMGRMRPQAGPGPGGPGLAGQWRPWLAQPGCPRRYAPRRSGPRARRPAGARAGPRHSYAATLLSPPFLSCIGGRRIGAAASSARNPAPRAPQVEPSPGKCRPPAVRSYAFTGGDGELGQGALRPSVLVCGGTWGRGGASRRRARRARRGGPAGSSRPPGCCWRWCRCCCWGPRAPRR